MGQFSVTMLTSNGSVLGDIQQTKVAWMRGIDLSAGFIIHLQFQRWSALGPYPVHSVDQESGLQLRVRV